MNLNVDMNEDNQGDSISIYGNIFTGKKSYSSLSNLQLSTRIKTPIDAAMIGYSITILYDTITKKIFYVSYNFPYSYMSDDEFIDFSCKLAHIIEPSKSTEVYSSYFKNNGLGTGLFYTEDTDTIVTLEASDYIMETGENENHQAFSIYRGSAKFY